MTAHEDAIRRVVADAPTLHDDEHPRVADQLRRHLWAGTRGAVVAATAGVMTLGPATATAALPADDTVLVQPVGRLWADQEAPVDQTATAPTIPPVVAPTVPVPPVDQPPPVDPSVPDAPTGPPPDEGDGQAPVEVIPGIRPPVVIPLNGRESMAPPRTGNPMPIPGPQIPNVGQPEIQGGRPPAPSAPPDPRPGGELPPLPVPQPDPSPSRPVIVGQAPAPSPVGGGISDITLDFSDPADADVAVETRPIPLGGITTYVVAPGDSLWSIATELLSDPEAEITTTEVGEAVEVIYEVNRAVIGDDPNLLAVGTTLEIPDEFIPETTTTADN